MDHTQDTDFYSKFNSPVKVSYLERRWKLVLQEERASYARNKKLLDDFFQVEEQMMLFSQRNESLKHAKQTFENYVRSVYPKWDKELKRLKKQKKLQENKKTANGKLKAMNDETVNNGEFMTMHNSPMTSSLTNKYPQNNDPQSTYIPRNDQYNHHGNNIPYFGHPRPMIGLNLSQFSTPTNHHQSYSQPWSNYQRYPGYMTDMIPNHHQRPPHIMYGGYENQMRVTGEFGERSKLEQEFIGNYSGGMEGERSFRSLDGSIRNISEERFREFEKWEKSVYGDQRHVSKNEQYISQPITNHQRPQPITHHHRGSQPITSKNNMYTSFEDDQEMKGAMNSSHEVKDIIHNDIPHIMTKDIDNSDATSKEISTFDKSVEILNKENESGIKSNHENSIELSESQSNEIKVTTSVSFPSCYQLEGELKDYYSSDTDQIIEEIDHSNRKSPENISHPTIDGSIKEGIVPTSNSTIQLSENQKDLTKKLDENSKADDEISKASKEVIDNSNSVDNILGEAISDFELSDVSDLEDADVEDLNESTPFDVSKNVSANQIVIEESGTELLNKQDSNYKKEEISQDGFINEFSEQETPKEYFVGDKVDGKQTDVDISTENTDMAHVYEEKSRTEDVSGNISHVEDITNDPVLSGNNSSVDKEQEIDDNDISVDEDILLELIRVIDDDIEVLFSTELLYRHDICTMEQKQNIIRSVERKESVEKYETAVISMLVLDQLPKVVQSLNKNGLLSEYILVNEQKYVHEKDLRAVIGNSFQTLWKHLYSHFIKIIEYDVMKAEEIAGIFAPCLGASQKMTDKVVNVLSRIILSSQEEYENTDILLDENDDQSVSSSEEESLPKAISGKQNSSKKEKSYSQDFDDDTEEKSASLTETDAYQKMLNSLKINDSNDVIDDLEDDLELTMSEANTSGQLKPRAIDHHQASTSNHKLSLFDNKMVDNDGSPVLNTSWKSSEASSPPLTPDLTQSGYIPTIVNNDNQERKAEITENKSDTKSRIKSGFWNKSDSESEVDLQVSHGENVDNNDDDFDFYS